MTAHRISLSQIAEQQGERMKVRKNERSPGYPPPKFWQAVNAMRNHTMTHCEADYRDDIMKIGPWKEGSLWEAINVVGDYLDWVIENGWIDNMD